MLLDVVVIHPFSFQLSTGPEKYEHNEERDQVFLHFFLLFFFIIYLFIYLFIFRFML